MIFTNQSVALVITGPSGAGKSSTVTSTQLLLGGVSGSSLYGSTYFLTNWTLDRQFTIPGGISLMLLFGVYYNAAINCVYFAGYSEVTTSPSYPSRVGDGSLLGMRWSLTNGSIDMLIRFGNVYTDAPF